MRSLKLFLAITVAFIAAGYAAVAIRQDWYAQQPYREIENKEREEQRAWDRVYAAADRLKSNGARYPIAWKGLEFTSIDFSGWKGSDSQLDDLVMLGEIANLNCYPHMQSTLSIRLGPAIGPSIVPRLLNTKNIAALDVREAMISEADLDRIREALPSCRIGPLGYDW
jgi:hypothetical protein